MNGKWERFNFVLVFFKDVLLVKYSIAKVRVEYPIGYIFYGTETTWENNKLKS